MEQKNISMSTSLVILIAGLLIGYFFGTNTLQHRGFFSNDMHEEMEEHMYGDAVVDGDGELQHMMDEMLLIGRGKTGEVYEEAFIRGMIAHHLGAVEMSEKLLTKTTRPELVQFANDVISTQSNEVIEMKGWLEMWFNEN